MFNQGAAEIMLLKKFLLMMMLLISGMSMMADDVQKLDAANIKRITFDGDEVIFTFNDGTSSTVADMSTVTVDFSNVTSVEDRLKIIKDLGLEGKQVYDLNGRKVGNSAATLKKGVYVIDKKKVTIQ